MAVRVVLVPNADGLVNAGPLLADLADDVADVMRDLSPVDTGDMRSTIRVLGTTANTARIGAGGIPGEITGELVDYVVYVERGTSRMKAQPFMRPALYRYRAGAR